VAVVLLVSYAVYRGGGLVASARMLQVDRIVVHGNVRLSNDAVMKVLDGLRGENVLWIDLDGWRERLLASPWIAEAALRRSLPGTVEVTVSERQPIGIGRVRGDMYLVDEHGVLIDRYGPQYADLDLPIIDGLPPSADHRTTDEVRAELASRVIGAIHGAPELGKRLSQVVVADAHNAGIILDNDPAVIRLGEDQFLRRLKSYLQLSDTLREHVPDIDYVDLRFDDRVYVRPTGKNGKSRSAAGAASRTPGIAAPHPAAGRTSRKRRQGR